MPLPRITEPRRAPCRRERSSACYRATVPGGMLWQAPARLDGSLQTPSPPCCRFPPHPLPRDPDSVPCRDRCGAGRGGDQPLRVLGKDADPCGGQSLSGHRSFSRHLSIRMGGVERGWCRGGTRAGIRWEPAPDHGAGRPELPDPQALELSGALCRRGGGQRRGALLVPHG